MLGILGKTLLKSGAKKIAKDKLLNRKKKTNKRRVSVKKIMGMEDKQKRGGALSIQPRMDLVPNEKDFDPVSDTSGESDIVIIRKQLIQVKDILKDSYTAKKEGRDEERKSRQTEKREKREEKLEKPKVKPKESKGMKMPNLGLGIGNFLSWLVMGIIVGKLLTLLPALKKIFGILKPITDFIGGLFNATMGFVVGFIDLSYKGVEELEKAIKAIGGEGAAELFEKFGKLFTQVLNGALIAALIGARVGLFNPFRRKPKIKPPKRSFSNQVKRRRNLNKRFFDPKRGVKSKRVRNIKKLREARLKRVKKFGRLRKFANFKNVGKNILNFKNLKNLKNLRGFGIGMLADMGVDRLFPNQAQNVANLQSRVLKNFKNFKPGQTLKNVGQGVTDVAQKAKNVAKTTAKKVSTTAKTTAKKVFTTAKKLTPALKSTTKTLSTAAKTTGKSTLKAVSGTLKSAKKIISPIVKKIPFVGALIDFALNYFVFKEPLGKSAFMAIGAGVGAWLGGMLGTLIPVPFVGTAIGAFIGGAGGDMLAGAIYDAIFKEKEPKKEDGEDKEMKEERTLTNRFDMDTGKAYINNQEVSVDEYSEFINLSKEEKLDKYGIIKVNSEDIISNNTQSMSQGLDTKPSYGSDGMMVLYNTTTYIQPVEV
jgi:F0F1-type ATP synthase assembly protein I